MRHKSRGNGQGTAYKRKGQATWTAAVVIGWRPPSKPGGHPIPIKRTRAGFALKKDALAYCDILLHGGVAPKKSAPRLSEYWDMYKSGELTKLSRTKQSAYKTAWNKLKPLYDVPVDLITVEMLRSAVSDACPTFDPAKDCKSVLSNLFALAGADQFADKSLPSYIVLPDHESKAPDPFSPQEQAALWKLYESGDKNAAIPLLMIYTGMMPGEAQNLRVEHIDLQARTITKNGLKTKVRKATPIVLSAAILPLVEDLMRNARPSGYVWKRNEEEWYANYYAALSAAGCRRLTPYSCRHTTATALAVTENVAPQTIRRVMRWSTTKMLDHYAHPQTADALSAVDRLKNPAAPPDQPPDQPPQ